MHFLVAMEFVRLRRDDAIRGHLPSHGNLGSTLVTSTPLAILGPPVVLVLLLRKLATMEPLTSSLKSLRIF